MPEPKPESAWERRKCEMTLRNKHGYVVYTPNLLDDYERLARENEEYKASFDLRYKADQRAIERWRKATGREMVLPDQADLCVWLSGENEELRRASARVKHALSSLFALVEGECPSLLEDDHHYDLVKAALAAKEPGK